MKVKVLVLGKVMVNVNVKVKVKKTILSLTHTNISHILSSTKKIYILKLPKIP